MQTHTVQRGFNGLRLPVRAHKAPTIDVAFPEGVGEGGSRGQKGGQAHLPLGVGRPKPLPHE